MNAQRRRRLAQLAEKLNDLQEALQLIMEEEKKYRDNMPESMQGGGRYADSEAISDALADVDDWMGDAVSSLCEIAQVTI